MANTKEYIREYYRKRRAKLYATTPDPETHPLRIWRKENGLSLAAAGRLFDVTSSTIWSWERGIAPVPEWVLEIIGEGMTDYMLRKIRSQALQHKQAQRNHPIRLWRKRLGIDQAKAAELLGVSRAALASWERGERSTPLWALAKTEEIKWL